MDEISVSWSLEDVLGMYEHIQMGSGSKITKSLSEEELEDVWDEVSKTIDKATEMFISECNSEIRTELMNRLEKK